MIIQLAQLRKITGYGCQAGGANKYKRWDPLQYKTNKCFTNINDDADDDDKDGYDEDNDDGDDNDDEEHDDKDQ